MSTTTGPFPLTAGTAKTIPQPGNAQQYGAVVLHNLSPYLLVVGAGSNSYLLSPYTADVFLLPPSAQPVTVNPQVLDATITGVSANVGAVWYDPTEEPDGTYPCALSSPAAIAAETAAALLTTGVPNVFLQDQLIPAQTLTPNLVATAGNVFKYTSLAIVWGSYTAGGPTIDIDLNWSDAAGNFIWFDHLGSPNGFSGATPGPYTSIFPVRGHNLALQNGPTSSVPITVYGSNQPVYADNVSDTFGSDVDAWSQGSQLLVAGTTYFLTQGNPGAKLSGLAYAWMSVSGTTAKGEWFVRSRNFGNVDLNIGDTTEATVIGNQNTRRLIALPANPYEVGFVCRTGGTAGLTCNFSRAR